MKVLREVMKHANESDEQKTRRRMKVLYAIKDLVSDLKCQACGFQCCKLDQYEMEEQIGK